MKKLIIIIGVAVLIAFLIIFLGTSGVETTPYFEEDYYKQTLIRLDSIKSSKVTVRDSLEAGFARVSITPVLGSAEDDPVKGRFRQVPLAGFGAREGKPAIGIHDSVFIRAAALRAGDQTLIFVAADLLIMPPNIVDSVTARLLKKGIRREQVFYSATHTHSSIGAWGTGYIGELFAGKENSAVEGFLVARVTTAILEALDDLRPARIAAGEFPIGSLTRNRLIGESGNKNNDFSYVTIEQTGHKKAVIGSYSAHATTLGADNMEISCDYPGYWSRKMEATTVDFALFFAGSVGSQSPAGEGGGYERAQYIGEALADSLNDHLSRILMKDLITFSTLSLKIKLPGYNIRLTTGRNLATTLSEKLLPLSQNVYLQSVRIDDMVWITTPADFSGEYALQLKHALAAAGFKGNVTSFNGSYVGYIVPGRYFYLDEYEPKVMGWFGPNMGDYTMDLIRQVSRLMTDADNL